MGFRQRIAEWIGGKEYQNAATFSADLEAALLGRSARAVSWQDAIQVTTMLRCGIIRAEEICSIPWKLYRSDGGDRIEVDEHPLVSLMRYGPNEWQTSFEFRSTIGLHLAFKGNAYVWLNRVGAGSRSRIIEMIPIEPAYMHVCRKDDWTIEYRWTMLDGTQVIVPPENLWHLKNHSWDSYKGLAALEYAANAIGLAKEIETAQRDTHKNYAKPSGVLSVDHEMDGAQFKETRKLIDAQVSTRLSRGLPMVVDKTMKWEQLAIKATDAQSVENRGFQVEEIGRAMGVLPIMLGYSGDKSITYASAEQMFIHQFVHNIRPRHRSFEQSADKKLLSDADKRAGLYTGLVDQELLRGDTKTRGEFYRLLWMIGATTGNEVRRFEDMNRLDGLDRPWAPLASAPIGEDGMPMIAEGANVDNNLIADQAAKAFGEAFSNAGPAARQRLLARLSEIDAVEAD